MEKKNIKYFSFYNLFDAYEKKVKIRELFINYFLYYRLHLNDKCFWYIYYEFLFFLIFYHSFMIYIILIFNSLAFSFFLFLKIMINVYLFKHLNFISAYDDLFCHFNYYSVYIVTHQNTLK